MNIDIWMQELESQYIDSSIEEVNGVKVSVFENSCIHDDDLSQTMYLPDYDIILTRSGYKEISYERWVESYWYEWVKS